MINCFSKSLTALFLIFVLLAPCFYVAGQNTEDILSGSSGDVASGSSVFVIRNRGKNNHTQKFRNAKINRSFTAKLEVRRSRIKTSEAIARVTPRPTPRQIPPANNSDLKKSEAAARLLPAAYDLLENKELNEAERMFFDITKLDASNVAGKMGLAKVYAARGDDDFQKAANFKAKEQAQPFYERAIGNYQKAVSYDPQNADFHASLGDAYDALQNNDKAIDAYRAARDLNPQLVELNVSLGELYYDKGNYVEAEKAFNAARTAKLEDEKLRDLYPLVLFKLERYDDALAALKKAVADNPNNAVSQYYLGEVYEKLGRGEEAIAALKKAVQIDSQYAEAYFDLGVAYYNQSRYEDAAEVYRKAKALPGNADEARVNLADTYWQMQKFPEAVNEYNIVITYKKDDPEILAKFGYALGKTKDWKRAVQYLTTASEKEPNAANYTNLAWAQNGAGNYAAGKQIALQALKLNSGYAAAYQNLGISQRGLGERQQALASFTKALDLKKNWVDALNSSGVVYMELENWSKAAEVLNQAVKLQPQFAPAYFNLGIVEVKRGNLKNAEKIRDILKTLNVYRAAELDRIIKSNK